jgi:hypothetical protein
MHLALGSIHRGDHMSPSIKSSILNLDNPGARVNVDRSNQTAFESPARALK